MTKRLGRNSIQIRLVGLIALMMAIMMSANLVIYSRINRMVRQIDSVFATNVTNKELTDQLEMVEESVYEYLSTKSSAALENYYRHTQNYREMITLLNSRNMDSDIRMLEKNIRSMSETYLQVADKTVQAKRGRNVERYKSMYEEESALFRYINSYIGELNNRQFALNSEHYQNLLRAMGRMEAISLAVMFLVFGLCIAVVLMTVRYLFRPLSTLSEAAERVAEGHFDVELPQVITEDEVGVVTRTFGQMLSSIRDYIAAIRTGMETEARLKQRELSMEASLKEAQLQFLQAQINPHFLFNSLNAGAQLAMMEDADQTGVFLERMADFFRYNVKHSDGKSTLAEEIESVDNYIYILNVRFAGDITYEKEILTDRGDYVMPGMILQPLVENAVTHGIRDMLPGSLIRLVAEETEGGLSIMISDNGAGMTRDQIAAVMEGKGSQAGKDQPSGSTGIGLANVINRLQLYYDRSDLLSIHSDGRGMGTEITILLPGQGQEEKRVQDTDRG